MRANDSDPDFVEVGYDPESGTYCVQHDWEDGETLTTTISRIVSVVRNVEPTAVEPLYDAIDAEALDAVVRSSEVRSVTVEFTYAGCSVLVDGDGTITVREIEE